MNVAMAAQMTNPLMLQEMMMNQMALMAQMAGAMGMVPPGSFVPGQPGYQEMGMANGMNNGFVPPHQQRQQQQQNGGRRGSNNRGQKPQRDEQTTSQPQPPPIPTPSLVAPQPVQATPAPTPTQQRPTYVSPERPQSPTLCKFGLKCTNPSCRYSHPSPVATPESGVVLSNDPCEQGKDCKDKDCVKAHVSPAVLNPKGTRTTLCPLTQTFNLFSFLFVSTGAEPTRASAGGSSSTHSSNSSPVPIRRNLYEGWVPVPPPSFKYCMPLWNCVHAIQLSLPTPGRPCAA